MSTEKLRVNTGEVLYRLADKARYMDDQDINQLAYKLDQMLNDLSENDFFGTEQQDDPRGDARELRLSLTKGVVIF